MSPKYLSKIVQQYHTYWEKQAMDCLNILKSYLDVCKDVDLVATIKIMMVIWDNGPLFGLNLFMANLFDYV